MTRIAEPEMEDTHYGVAVSYCSEDLDNMLALGHHDARRALAAFNRHARTLAGLANLANDYSADADDWFSQIQPKWATFRTPDPHNDWEDPASWWIAEWCDPETPGAQPVTLLAT
ncbi:hypothetical protein [Streptomyces nanshensis]|uniref:Uncharacterized protein n=1 Tax=Streptomyces nanshensis TaxID=518642 RepID=A0A1E7LD20_9ACTN|nr:hypothetical protein [Streptomyces nanshensis]OEV14068.1 hypothetical protein AN218_00925 [Streptomyces nanshensis]